MSPDQGPAPCPCSGSRSPCHVPALDLCPRSMTQLRPHAVSPSYLHVPMPCPCPVPCPWGASPPWDPSTAHGTDGSRWPLPVGAGRERDPHPGDKKGTSGCPHTRPCSAGTPRPATSRARSHQVALRGHRGHRCPAPNPTLSLIPNLSLHGPSHRMNSSVPNLSPHGHSYSDNSPILRSVPKSAPPWAQPA